MLLENFLSKGFECYIAGLMSLPVAANFLVLAILTVLLSLIIVPVKLLLGFKTTAGLFLFASLALLLLLWLAQRLLLRLSNGIIYRNSTVIPLDAAGDAGLKCAGFKGRGLALLARMGMMTAPGFVINGSVFRDFAEKSGLSAELATLPGGTDCESRVLSHLEKRALPSGVVRKIMSEMKKMGGGRLILRSSFPGEDGAGRSMAGVYRSLVVESAEAGVEGALKSVWASFFSEAAACARGGSAARGESLFLPVIVQRVVEHDVFFAACSVNLMNGREEEMVFDYAAADGRAGVVSLNKLTGGIGVAGESGERPFPDAALRSLADALLSLEAELERPVQIEAGLKGGDIYFYQVRPLTGFVPVESFVNSFIADLIDVPLTPLSRGLFNLPDSVESLFRNRFAPFGLSGGIPLIAEISGRFYLRYNPVRAFLNPHYFKKPRRVVPSSLLTLKTFFAALSLGRTGKKAVRISIYIETALEKSLSNYRDGVLIPLFRLQFDLFTLCDALGKTLDSFLKRARAGHPGLDSLLVNLRAPAFDSPFKKMLRELSALNPDDKTQLERFREKFGHWGSPEAEVAAARIADDLAPWLSLRAENDTNDGGVENRARAEVEKLLAERWKGRPVNTGRMIFHFLYSRLQTAMRIREEVREKLNFALHAAAKKARAGAKGDIAFFMTVDEFDSGLVETNTLNERKASYQNAALERPAAIVHNPETSAEQTAAPNIILAMGIGRETVSGRALVAAAPVKPPSEKDTILVIERPDSAFGTMLGAISGLVIERGSPLSHLVILARERGIPVLVGARDACALIKTGDKIRVAPEGGWLRIGD